ncbi:MAG: hypothetical protein II838_13150 [Lachnospiraceae bacterium]|nr:hypothetical protein [Lachnospiraceae bacterium]
MNGKKIAILLAAAICVTSIPFGNAFEKKASAATTNATDCDLHPIAIEKTKKIVVKNDKEKTTGLAAKSYNYVTSKKALNNSMYYYMNKRKTTFTITYKGKLKNVYNGSVKKMFKPIWSIDKKTTDDFDYLYANIRTYGIKHYYVYSNRVKFTFKVTYRESAKQTKLVNEKIKKIFKEELILDGMTRVQKIKAIHDYICKIATYDNTLSRFTAYEGLVDPKHTFVCQGYSLLFYKMCTTIGIPCRLIPGDGYSGGESAPHAWNIVKVDGKWYHVDVTWDDYDMIYRPVGYDYFLVGSDMISQDHVLDSDYRTSSFKKKYPISKTSYVWSEEPDSTDKPIATLSPLKTAAPNATVSPTSTPSSDDGITREEYAELLVESYKKAVSYDTYEEATRRSKNLYIDFIETVILNISDDVYDILADEIKNNKSVKLGVLLDVMDSVYTEEVISEAISYMDTDEYDEKIDEILEEYPSMSQREAALYVLNEKMSSIYESKKSDMFETVQSKVQ